MESFFSWLLYYFNQRIWWKSSNLAIWLTILWSYIIQIDIVRKHQIKVETYFENSFCIRFLLNYCISVWNKKYFQVFFCECKHFDVFRLVIIFQHKSALTWYFYFSHPFVLIDCKKYLSQNFYKKCKKNSFPVFI